MTDFLKKMNHYLSLDYDVDIKEKLFEIRNNELKKDYQLFHLVYKGIFENKLFFDSLIDYYIKSGRKKLLDYEIKYFYIVLYLIIFTNKKDYAIVNEVVNIVKKKRFFMSKVFNAVLRNVIRDKKHSFSFIKKDNVRLSINESLYNELRADLTKEEINKMVNKKDNSIYAIDTNKNFFKLNDPYKIDDNKIYILSKSIYESYKFKIEANSKVLDLMASPGGKTILLKLLNSSIKVTSCDISEQKLEKIRENVERLDLKDINIVKNDALKINESFIGAFDVVVVDTLCSSTGNLNKIPNIKLSRNRDEISELVKKQRKIFSNALNYMNKNGRIVYSTCSVLRKENELNTEHFLKEHNLELENEYRNLDFNDGFYLAIFKRSK